MTLHQKFDHPIAIPAVSRISTVGEALNFYFSLSMHERIEWHWTEAANLLTACLDETSHTFLVRAENQFKFALERRALQSLPAAA
jgi:hypothetical protein